MKRILAIFAVLSLTACDGHDKANAPAEQNAAPTRSPALGSARANQPSAEEAKTFILSKLEMITRNGQTLHFSDITLGNPWRWTETNVTSDVSDSAITTTTKTSNYSVDPAMLRLPVRVEGSDQDGWNIKFECSVKDCISVKGNSDTTLQGIYEKEPTHYVNDISVPQSSNYWWFKDKESAERTARAMNVLLTSQGARESAF